MGHVNHHSPSFQQDLVSAVSHRTRCRICHTPLVSFLDLGVQPPANAFIGLEQVSAAEPSYPLQTCYCPFCHLVQLADVVDRLALFTN